MTRSDRIARGQQVRRRLTDQERLWRTVPESDVVRAVLDYVARLGGYAWRQNTGGGYFQNRQGGKQYYVQFAEKGACDIIAVVPHPSGGGVALFIETKTELGKQSDEQRDWQAQIEAAGGVYLLVRPSNWEDVITSAVGVLAERREGNSNEI